MLNAVFNVRARTSLLASVAVSCLLGGAVQASALDGGALEPIAITVTKSGCVPTSVSIESGKTTFKITNESSRAMEWEILKGVMVVEERENIVPGFVQTLTATLDPGEYQMTCGLLSNPKGILKVTASTEPKKD